MAGLDVWLDVTVRMNAQLKWSLKSLLARNAARVTRSLLKGLGSSRAYFGVPSTHSPFGVWSLNRTGKEAL